MENNIKVFIAVGLIKQPYKIELGKYHNPIGRIIKYNNKRMAFYEL